MAPHGSTAEPAPFDFRQPAPVTEPFQRPLVSWQERAQQCLPEKIAPLLPLPLQWTAQGLRSRLAKDPKKPPHVGCPIHVGPHQDLTLLLLPRPLCLTLVQGMLGDSLQEMVSDRHLTTLERTLLESLIDGMVAAIDDTRPRELAEALQRRECIEGVSPTRLFPSGPRFICLEFQLAGPFGTGLVSWMWPEAVVHDRFGVLPEATAERADTQLMLGVVQQLPLQLVVRLGSARIGVSQLANLQVGDVVILDQRVGEELTATIDGQERLLGWPGRQGSRQAFQISRVLP